MQGEILQLFPTPVGKLSFRKIEEEEQYILNFSCNQTESNAGNRITLNKNILDSTGLFNLKTDITNILNEYYSSVYSPRSNVTLYITTSWCNVSYNNDFHHNHVHHNSILSGVLYLEADGNDSITFTRNLQDKLTLLTYPQEENVFNNFSCDVEIKKGDLVLFPSTLYHSVKPLKREGPRISLSFNTFAKGVFGDEDTLTQLILS